MPIDELLIEQVFINLLENAVKYTAPGTPITVSAWQEDDVVRSRSGGPGGPGFRREKRKPSSASSTALAGANQAEPRRRLRAGPHDLPRASSPRMAAGFGWSAGRQGGAAFRFTLPLEGTPPRGSPRPDVVA